ncbi:MAG: alcohol dehydrogenase catalytic domain-containing protein, partial [Thermoanaerobaculia bacterium]
MKTVEVRGFGSPEHLVWIDAPTPRPGPGEMLLRLAACGLNHADLLMRQGTYLGGPRPPFRPGMEAAGTVEEVGPAAPGGIPGPVPGT